jgi:hypothetical protein
MKRTTVDIPEELWKKAKVRAVEEGADLRQLILRGLELVLAQKPKRGGT